MSKLKQVLKKSFIVSTLVIYIFGLSTIGFTSSIVFAEDQIPALPPCPTASGTVAPTGAAAVTYSFNPVSCLWENSYFTWDPITKIITAKYDQTPLLNSQGTAWEYIEWIYNPSAGSYGGHIVSIPVPAPATTPTTPGTGVNSSESTPGVPGVAGAGSQLLGSSSTSNTGPNSSNNYQNGGNLNGNINLANNSSINTIFSSLAGTGNAIVMGNTTAGNATSGNAEAVGNFLNMIQSSWDPTLGNVTVFNAGLFGNFFGDILFNPEAIISNTGPSSNNNITNDVNGNLNINVSDTSNINNNIKLAAITGNATVSQNTNAGNAMTGNATTIANIINMINSSIATGNSFIGTLDIYGNLVGDLLLPQSILAQLKNTGPNSKNNIANNNSSNVNLVGNNQNSINNNLNLSASSGNAAVDSNTNAGNATTGSANTNAKQVNVIGKNSSGTKGLAVLVNVLGTWVGMLWDGSGTSSIDGTGPNSSNNISNTNTLNLNANVDQTNNITNNIELNSQTGNATVSNNTNAGNAKSGNASSAVNLLNMIDSNMAFTDWFGILFINVFGNWQGSFGVDTSAGNSQSNGSSSSSNNASALPIQIIPKNVSKVQQRVNSNQVVGVSSSDDENINPGSGVVLSGASTDKSTKLSEVLSAKNDNKSTSSNILTWLMLAAVGSVIGLIILLGAEDIMKFGRKLLNM